MALYPRYPHNWRKAVRVLRRITGNCCEECGKPAHSVHHKGAPRPTGRKGKKAWTRGNRHDKHDLRRENLAVLCFECHDAADNGALSFYAALARNGRKKKANHRALGVGTGLVVLKPVHVSWSALLCLHYALLRWSKRTGRTRYQLLSGPSICIVDSYLVKEISYERTGS